MPDNHGSEQVDRRSILKTIGAGTLAAAGGLGISNTVSADSSSEHYHNPVGPVGFGDVSVIQDGDTYYAYGTETPNDIVPVAESTNLVDWTYTHSALDSYPDWRSDDAGVWAPDINYYNGQYHLYYSYSKWGSSDNPGIGLATAANPDDTFTDQGPVFRANDLGMTNCIDAEFRVVDGTPYMIWGSWYGIYGVQLTSDGADYVSGTTFHLAGDKREGPMIVEENGYYYLFYSTGHCCEGSDSTYEVEVGRAESLQGPYYNREGTDLRDLNSHHSGVAVLSSDSQFTGPGHNDAIQDANGDWWMVYHVEATSSDETRYMMLDRIQWTDDDWPVVARTGTPSSQSPRPNRSSYDRGALPDGTYHVRNVHSGRLMEVAGASTSDGANVQQYTDTGNTCQDWSVSANGDGTYTISNVNSGKLLEVAGASTSDGANIQQYADTGSSCQDWVIEDVGNGQFRLTNANSGKVAEVANAGTANGDNVQQWTDNGGAHQLWTFTQV
ncbi:family 43 glycosylhydrolase [Halarchaeum sp. P4]|uniref:family 43 glycosylhydrolase n=1 Tax=Halarchaeum sp. P4 TaxID=3421639 RepID=UPI003EBD05C8